MKKLGKALGAVAIVGAVAAGGAAFTESNTLPSNNTAGYSSTTVTGVTATTVTYGLNATGDTIQTVNLVLQGDTRPDTIQLAFNGGNSATCSGAGAYDAGNDDTTYACTVSQATSGLTTLHVIATNTN
jgi:hypothetical protein